jgi:hypothetical protein
MLFSLKKLIFIDKIYNLKEFLSFLSMKRDHSQSKKEDDRRSASYSKKQFS